MLDQFFRFFLSLTWSGLFYMVLAIVGVESWRLTSAEESTDDVRFLINALALVGGATLAYWLQSGWVFRRRRALAQWGRYMAFMLSLGILHELLLSVMLFVLPVSYPITLLITLCLSLGLAFIVCKKYIF
jgi:hypothetical protein